MSSLSDLKARMDARKKVSPAVFSENMKLREETHHLGMTCHCCFCIVLDDNTCWVYRRKQVQKHNGQGSSHSVANTFIPKSISLLILTLSKLSTFTSAVQVFCACVFDIHILIAASYRSYRVITLRTQALHTVQEI